MILAGSKCSVKPASIDVPIKLSSVSTIFKHDVWEPFDQKWWDEQRRIQEMWSPSSYVELNKGDIVVAELDFEIKRPLNY